MIAVRFDLTKSTAVIATNDSKYIVVGVLAVDQLYHHFHDKQ